MTTQALTLPVDIPWRRFAYSADMIDTNFGDLALPPKWRSSLAVYYYVVPKEQTAESYPDGRIVYLRLTCSITGFNLSEDLENSTRIVPGEDDRLDTVQRESWEAIKSAGWADAYMECLGAIAQIAVHPGSGDEVGSDAYPFIYDFEPKKRELYETRSESGEFLSASSGKVNVQKGTTTTGSTEESEIQKVSGGVGFSFGPFGASVEASEQTSLTKNSGWTDVDMRTIDGLQEARATTSHTTTISQMYQLFNGYHLGTNRALFVIAPRPHIVSGGEQVEFNLLRGKRKLEGIQDMFLVVHLPKLKGLCIQASLDTGHPLPPPKQPGEEDFTNTMIVTRRMIQNCATFNDAGELIPAGGVELPSTSRLLNPIVFETVLSAPSGFTTLSPAALASAGREERVRAANEMNLFEQEFAGRMLDGFSAGKYKPRPFVETETFRRLATTSFRDVKLELSELVKLKYLSKTTSKTLREAGVRTVGDLFNDEVTTDRIERKEVDKLRGELLAAVMEVAKRERENGYAR